MSRGLLAVVLGLGLLAWVTGVFEAAFDYDEVLRAHSIWQIGQGLVPFRDFCESYSPFLLYLFVPVMALLPAGPELMLGLRLLSGLGFALWVAALLASARASRPALRGEWLVTAGCVAGATPLVLDFAAQFRADHWAWAGAFAALARFVRRAPGWRRTAELGFAGTVCTLALPKLAVLFPAFCTFDLVQTARARGPLARELAGYAVGVAAGVATAAGVLWTAGVDPLVAWQLTISFHGYIATRTGFGHGVLHEVLAAHLALAIALLGIAAWATWLVHRRTSPTPLELAVLVTCAAQIAWVPFPYAQYVAPVFVLSAVFLPYLGLWAEEWASRWRPAPRVAQGLLCALATAGFAASLAGNWESGQAARFAAVQNAVLALAPADARIAVPPPFHPIVRHDAFFGLVLTWLPSGLTPEETLRRLALPSHERRGFAAYRRELDAHEPAVILYTGGREFFYSPEQSAAIASYLADHADGYRRVPGVEPALWVRADLIAPADAQLVSSPRPE